MTLGLVVSLLVTFLLLPSLLSLLSNDREINIQKTKKSIITSLLGSFAKKNKLIIFAFTLTVIIVSLVGISKLQVENSFINYFDKETEIYKGMKKIDDDLGGTTPLNVILKFPVKETKLIKSKEITLMSGKMKTKMRTKLNIGLLGTRSIK